MNSVFVDSSGDIKDKFSRIIAYASLIVSDSTMGSVEKRYLELIEQVGDRDLCSNPAFEFHTIDMVTGSRLWRGVKKVIRMRLLKEMRSIILELKIPFVVLLINKDEAGIKSTKRFTKMVNEAGSIISIRKKGELGDRLKKEVPGININLLKRQPLTNMIALFFGLTVALVNNNRIGKSTVKADQNLVIQKDLWKAIFLLFRTGYWQEFVKSGAMFTWPADEPPQWLLTDEIEIVDSVDEFGIQLADFIAYTTRYLLIPEKHKLSYLAPTRNLAPLMSGVHATIGNYK